ncbi:keratinolytic protein, partial [Metarhizium brunneum ARSEF 3297]
MPRCVVSQAPKRPKVGRGVNTTKASNTAKVPKVNKITKVSKVSKKVSKVSKKVSKDDGKGKGCKSARAKKLPSTARPPREHARQTFPLSNVRGCPHAEDDAEHAGHAGHADAATIAPAPRPGPPATPPGSRRSNIASKIKRLRMAPDHLLQFPQVNHRYLSAQGRILFDNRYEVPPSPPADSPKRLPRHTKAAPKATHAVAQAGSEDAFHSKPMINLPVPDHIQAMLVDDWENITKNNQLVPLPHPKPVTRILEDYLSFERPHREEGSASMDILVEVVAGFREYFEKALSRILLYRFERHQYMDLRKLWDNVESTKYKSVCDVYGAEHLSRLLVSLPELLAQTNMDQQSVSRLREEIGKFTVWLGRHCETYFVNEYETPSQEYVDKARSF